MSAKAGGLGRFLSMLVCGFAVEPALSAETAEGADVFSVSFNAGATHSDNIARTATARESETSIEAGVAFNLDYARERLVARAAADLQYRTHDYGTYGNELVGGLDGSMSYELVRERLLWVVEDNLGQSLINSQDVVTPDNTQNVNFFSTGPDLLLPLGTRTGINFQGRWSDVSYDESDYGNTRLSGTVSLVRQTGEASTLSLNGSIDSVEYTDLPPISDYEIRSAYFGWDAKGSRTSLSLQIGYTTLEDQIEKLDGTLFGLEITRKMTSRSTVSLNMGTNFGDSADALKRDQGIRGVSVGDRPAIVSSDPQQADYATLSWQFDGARSSMVLSADWRQESHERDADLDREYIGAGFDVYRQLSARLSLNLNAGYHAETYDVSDIDFDEWGGGIGLAWSFTPAFGVSATWDHLVGSGDTTLGPDTRDYTENRFTVQLSWSPGL